MTRVYLDTNAFSNLKKKVNEVYADLGKAIELYSGNLSFVFSPAHIRDKRKDPSDMKLADFEFMETLVQDNYLSYHMVECNTTFYLATPRRVFDDNADGVDLSTVVNRFQEMLTWTDVSNIEGKDNSAWVTDSVKDHLAQNQPLTQVQLALVNNAFPEAERQNIGQMMKRFLAFSQDMYTNHETYKTLRSILDENFNNGKFNLNGELDFNKAFEDSAFNTSFTEFVKSTLTVREDGKVLWYDFFQQCYLFLDMFGIAKDKIKEKNNFMNLFNDSLHAYYAQYCDYFVSDDESTRKKTKALYGMMGIATKIMDARGFLSELAIIGPDSESNMLHFFGNLWMDISREQVKREGIEGTTEETSISYDTKVKYLNYFDRLAVLKGDGQVIYILHSPDQPLIAKPNYREIGKIIDHAKGIFGRDWQQKDGFAFEREVSEIQNGSWTGRYWQAGGWLIKIYKQENWGGLIMTVALLPESKEENQDQPE